MIPIQNTDAITAIRDGAKLSVSEGFPQTLLPNVQAVMDMTPNHHRVVKIVKRASSGTLYTTPTDRDFYMTNIQLSIIKDAAATGSQCGIQANIDGQVVQLIEIACLTLTADAQTTVINFTVPVKLDRASAIAFFTTGAFSAVRGIVYGYEVVTNG